MNEMCFDPVITEIANDVRYDRTKDQLFLRGKEVPGTGWWEWRAALPTLLYMAYHVGRELGEVGVDALRPDERLEKAIVDITPILQRPTSGPMLGPTAPGSTDPKGVYTFADGLKVLVPEERVLSVDGDIVHYSTSTLRPRLSAGFMFYIRESSSGRTSDLLRIYRSADQPEELFDTWSELARYIDEENVPVRMKMLSRLYEYPRRDALVLYLDKGAWPKARQLCRLAGGRDEAPCTGGRGFARQVGARTMCAWEPVDATAPSGRESFGQHRSRKITEALLGALENQEASLSRMMSTLESANIDPTALHRNLTSPEMQF